MKKIAAALLLIALMIPTAALAYIAPSGDTMYNVSGQSGQLNQELYTRTGPGTEYSSLGTINSAGKHLDVHSITYDRNGVAWVQVSARVNGLPVRVYTGLKRFDGLNVSWLFRDSNYNEVVHTRRAARPRFGPGYHYATYNFVLPEYTEVRIIQIECDLNTDEYFTACDFYYNGSWHRGWFESDIIP